MEFEQATVDVTSESSVFTLSDKKYRSTTKEAQYLALLLRLLLRQALGTPLSETKAQSCPVK